MVVLRRALNDPPGTVVVAADNCASAYKVPGADLISFIAALTHIALCRPLSVLFTFIDHDTLHAFQLFFIFSRAI